MLVLDAFVVLGVTVVLEPEAKLAAAVQHASRVAD